MRRANDDYNVDYGQGTVFGSGVYYASQPPAGQTWQNFGAGQPVAYTKPKPNYDLFKPHEDRSAPLYKGKRITVYRNGDAFYRGMSVCISQRIFPTFDSLLRHLDSKKILENRPCNKLFDLDGRAMRAIEEIQDGGEYVAATRDFIAVGYGEAMSEAAWRTKQQQQKRDEPRSLYTNERDATGNPATMPTQFKAKPVPRSVLMAYQEPSSGAGDGVSGDVPYYLRGGIDRRPPPPNVSRKQLVSTQWGLR